MAVTTRMGRCNNCDSPVQIQFEPDSLLGMFDSAGFGIEVAGCDHCKPINHDGTPRVK